MFEDENRSQDDLEFINFRASRWRAKEENKRKQRLLSNKLNFVTELNLV